MGVFIGLYQLIATLKTKSNLWRSSLSFSFAFTVIYISQPILRLITGTNILNQKKQGGGIESGYMFLL